MEPDHLQRDSEHPTGTVQVELDEEGTPEFTIVQGVAWDYMESDERWTALAGQADAICFGTLAQRSPQSRRAIHEVLRAADGALVVCDVNIRQDFYSREVLTESLAFADILKLNEGEVSVLQSELIPAHGGGEDAFLRRVMADYGIRMACVTLGPRGCRVLTRQDCVEKPVPPTDVVDTVGSGDAFTAGMVVKYLEGADANAVAEAANLMGAYVAGCRGATPELDEALRAAYSRIG
jgi:fructokinase